VKVSFLQEIANHKLVDGDLKTVIICYGISQHPVTKNYIMVMEYMEGGDLRQYLKNNYIELGFDEKLLQLYNIIVGLGVIHDERLIHRDFHPGNILKDDNKRCYITDLGLCRPVNGENEDKIYGVLPYVAPEVLNSKPYTQASDIYSFGIIAYELMSDFPPYVVYDQKLNSYREMSHDTDLALAICQGLRPDIDRIPIPQLLKDLIKRC
jgi:serine/threonine protein kinase